MKKNVGPIDRIIRFVLMDLLIGAAISGYESLVNLSWILLIISAGLLISVISGFSLIYKILGINTKYLNTDSGDVQDTEDGNHTNAR